MPAIVKKDYPVKVWGLTILLAPALMILYAFITAFDNSKEGHVLWFYLYSIIFGGLFSLPAFILAYMAFAIAISLNYSNKASKLVFFLTSFAGMIGTFYFFLRENIFDFTTPFTWTYLAALIITTALCKIGSTSHLVTTK